MGCAFGFQDWICLDLKACSDSRVKMPVHPPHRLLQVYPGRLSTMAFTGCLVGER